MQTSLIERNEKSKRGIKKPINKKEAQSMQNSYPIMGSVIEYIKPIDRISKISTPKATRNNELISQTQKLSE